MMNIINCIKKMFRRNELIKENGGSRVFDATTMSSEDLKALMV